MHHGGDMATVATTPPVPLWRNRDYVLLWCGQLVNVMGTQVSQIAYPLLVLALTNSPAQAGFVAAARTVPYLLFSLPAGALVDRWNRKVVMILCSVGGALALGSIAVAFAFGVLTIAQIVVVSFVEGTLSLVFGLAESSALSQVVAREQLPEAVAQSGALGAVGTVIGPSLGGVLYGITHLLPFVVDACSYAVSAGSLGFIRTRLQGQRTVARRSLVVEIGEGVGWIWGQPLIRYMAFLTGSLNFANILTLTAIVILTRAGVSSSTVGVVFAVAGVGGIAGALLAPRIQRRLSFGQAVVAICWFLPAMYLLFAVTRLPVLIALLFAVVGLVSPAYNTVQLSYRLALIPDALQGRVNSAFRLVAQGMTPLGAALAGVLIERVGVTATILAFAGWLLVVAVLTSANRHVRHAPALTAQT